MILGSQRLQFGLERLNVIQRSLEQLAGGRVKVPGRQIYRVQESLHCREHNRRHVACPVSNVVKHAAFCDLRRDRPSPFTTTFLSMFDLTLIQCAVMFRRSGGETLVEFQHLLEEFDHADVATDAFGATAPRKRIAAGVIRLSVVYPLRSTTPISSSVSPYNSYTSRSISRSVAST